MIVVTYTGKNYKKCLDLMLPTWQRWISEDDEILVYTDTDEFGIKMFEPTEDFNESCRRKIQVIKRTLEENIGENVLYIDTDVMMMSFINQDVFNNDLNVTRMVHRADKGGEKDINAGVSFWRANEFTVNFCEVWLEEEKLNQDHKYPEQHAFNKLAYDGFDGRLPIIISVGVLSERLYNFEHDNPNVFLKWIPVYRPKLIHFKSKRWGDEWFMKQFYKVCSKIYI